MLSFILGMAFLVACHFAWVFIVPTDSTDKSRWKRSGLGIHTDHATGVQYVKAGYFGEITPRIDKDGKPYIGK